MYTREAFERQRASAKQVESHQTRLLAVVSVGLGVAQLIGFRWLETWLERRSRIRIEGAVFLVYMALVGWLIWRMQRRLRAARVTCPQCGVRMEGLSERVAGATGRCDACGGQVLEPTADVKGPTPAADIKLR
jgi:predicted RNA-binding Zn-ribbon protein involved in translation (DUF1610 family)